MKETQRQGDRWRWRMAVVVVCLAVAAPARTQHHRPPQGMGGEVRFATTCKPIVSGMFDRGMGSLFAFDFVQAIEGFRLVAHNDIDCAMAGWGTALAHWGLWRTRGTPAELELGRTALDQARLMRRASPRERRYVAAAAELFTEGRAPSESFRAFASAMALLSRDFPDDSSAAALAALALFEQPERDLSAALANRRSARRALATAQRRGDHAGVAHFAMLTADDAASAARVVDTAYASAGAGTTAYALHLPSHVFIRRGLWTEAIDANLRAGDAARRDGQVEDELHALDALVYGLLQLGKDREAARIAARAPALAARVVAGGTRAMEARAAVVAMPARVPLERGDWDLAAALPLAASGAAWAVQVTHLVRALGAARGADAHAARRELTAAGVIDASGAEDERGPVAAAGVESLRQVADGWTAFAEGRTGAAVDALTRAAAAEADRDAADWPLSALVCAQEQLAEMLLLQGRATEAVTAFQTALTAAPHRLRSIVGVADAAARSGQRELAAGYAARVAAIAAAADRPLRPELAAAVREKP